MILCTFPENPAQQRTDYWLSEKNFRTQRYSCPPQDGYTLRTERIGFLRIWGNFDTWNVERLKVVRKLMSQFSGGRITWHCTAHSTRWVHGELWKHEWGGWTSGPSWCPGTAVLQDVSLGAMVKGTWDLSAFVPVLARVIENAVRETAWRNAERELEDAWPEHFPQRADRWSRGVRSLESPK